VYKNRISEPEEKYKSYKIFTDVDEGARYYRYLMMLNRRMKAKIGKVMVEEILVLVTKSSITLAWR